MFTPPWWLLVWLFVSSLGLHRVLAAIVCQNTTTINRVQFASDFLFLIDISPSMCPYQLAIADGLSTFVQNLADRSVNARFGIVTFGGLPSIYLPFTMDGNVTQSALRAVGCSGLAQEAGLEAIRVVLTNPADLAQTCMSDFTTSQDCSLQWNPASQKQIILVTDEDSDLPLLAKYTLAGQNASAYACATTLVDSRRCPKSYPPYSTYQFEPTFSPSIYYKSSRQNQIYRNSPEPIVLADVAYAEIAATANAILSSQALVSILIKSDFNANIYGPQSTFDSHNAYYNTLASSTSPPPAQSTIHTSLAQYGNPGDSAENDDYTGFDSARTLQNLQGSGLAQSLQALVLQGNGYLRTYALQDFCASGNATMSGSFYTSNFFDQVVHSVICMTVPGGNLSSSGLQIGASLYSAKLSSCDNISMYLNQSGSPISLLGAAVVNGNVTNQGSLASAALQVYFGDFYGANTSYPQSNASDLSLTFQYLSKVSSALLATADNARYELNNSQISIGQSSPEDVIAIVTIAAGDLSRCTRLVLDSLPSQSCNQTLTLILNIEEAGDIQVSNLDMSGLSPYQTHLVLNFANATTVAFSGNTSLFGMVLAPSATLTRFAGRLNGSMFVREVSLVSDTDLPSYISIESAPFQGCLPFETVQEPPIATSTTIIAATVAGGVAAVGAAGAAIFFYRTNFIRSNILTNAMTGNPFSGQMNPLYQSPGGLHDNPLYEGA
ncbi:uncharacterized protein BJ171DRAFT_580392 [Polychytrium aggregatum]|uniref:uncharacterized protein n=1 Tax=Polychytrium aggregatum TaxID=110093 RepID=UPI0022FE147A|nr:uncharacterized protein BJ171DRAFT_580392 [Polychytrium aggregatum]KAI9205746.1 hypothetical protein BJ171DRAFT_580392 [Polychytrium aggregatum]